MKLFRPLLAIALTIALTGASVARLQVNQLVGFGAAASSGAAAISVTDSPVQGACTNCSFASTSFGAEAADRVIAVGIGGGAQTRTVSSVTIGGISATFVVRGAGANETSELWYASVPTGTTGTVVVNWSGAQDGCGIVVARITGASAAPSASGSDNDSDPATVSLTIPAGGVAFGYISQRHNSGAYTWTNLTEEVDEAYLAGTFFHSGATAAFETQQTGLTITGDPDTAGVRNPLLVVGAWGPS